VPRIFQSNFQFLTSFPTLGRPQWHRPESIAGSSLGPAPIVLL